MISEVLREAVEKHQEVVMITNPQSSDIKFVQEHGYHWLALGNWAEGDSYCGYDSFWGLKVETVISIEEKVIGDLVLRNILFKNESNDSQCEG